MRDVAPVSMAAPPTRWFNIAGPCYAVNANQTLDYFGQTVNCASRVQHLAESGEIVLEESAFDDLDEATRNALSVIEKVEAKVKGVDGPLHLVRTRPSALPQRK